MSGTTYYAFCDELEKIAAPRVDEGDVMAGAGGAAAGTAAGTAGVLGRYKGLRIELGAHLASIGKGGARAIEAQEAAKRGTPPQVIAQAKAIAKEIRRRGLDPKKINIAIGATGGTGKTTLARELARQLGLEHRDLDAAGKHITKGRQVEKYIESAGLKGRKGIVMDQSHIFTKANPGHFDVAIRLEKPTAQIRKQLERRKRGAWQMDVYDYDRMSKSIRSAFDGLGGDKLKVDTGVEARFAPQRGFDRQGVFRQAEHAVGEAKSKAMSREKAAITAATGKVPRAPSAYRYFRLKHLAGVPAMIGGGALAGLTGAVALKRHLEDRPQNPAMRAELQPAAGNFRHRRIPQPAAPGAAGAAPAVPRVA